MSLESKDDARSIITLSTPPFVPVEGVINIRTIGGYSTADGQWIIPPLRVFRSGELSKISATGVQQFRGLGIGTVFDLRNDSEIKDYGAGSPSIEGVEVVRLPVFGGATWETANIITRLKNFQVDEIGTMVELYLEIFDIGGSAFNTIFTHLRDSPDVPCLIHCTSGKDRTGVFAALLLMLLGVGDSDIAKDYALTTVGLAPFIPQLAIRYQSIPVFRDQWDGFVKMGSSKEESMTAALIAFRKNYGSVERYFKEKLEFTNDDIVKIRTNLLVRKD